MRRCLPLANLMIPDVLVLDTLQELTLSRQRRGVVAALLAPTRMNG